MVKPNPMQRKSSAPLGMSLKTGMTVAMSDGWRGKVEQDVGGLVVCIADGETPNDHWLGDYRILGRSAPMRIDGNRVKVDWRSTSAARRTADRKQRQSDVVADLLRCAREWSDAPGY